MGRRNKSGPPNVKVVQEGRTGTFKMRWKEGGRWREKTAKVNTRRQAERAARDLERDMAERHALGITWEALIVRYDREHLAHKSTPYRKSTHSAIASYENLLPLNDADEVTTETISRWATHLRSQNKSDASVRSYIKHLLAMLRWGEQMDLVERAPRYRMRHIETPGMRGRPITRAEFEQMLDACKVIRPQDWAIWDDYLKGLWLSGLRLRESLALSWDTGDDFVVDLSGTPCYHIHGSDKKRRHYLAPMPPDFATYLADRERSGKVWQMPVNADQVGKIVAKLGAGIDVGGKTATAHDIRRAFGTRWARALMPADLKELMRHSNVSTTMKFYVRASVDSIGEELQKKLHLAI
jgi:integrase